MDWKWTNLNYPLCYTIWCYPLFGSAVGYTFLWKQEKGNPACGLFAWPWKEIQIQWGYGGKGQVVRTTLLVIFSCYHFEFLEILSVATRSWIHTIYSSSALVGKNVWNHVFPWSLLSFVFKYIDAKIHQRHYRDCQCCILGVFYQILLNIGVSCYLYRSSKEVLQMLSSCKGYIGGCAATVFLPLR